MARRVRPLVWHAWRTDDGPAALPPWGGWKSDNSAHFASTYATRNFYGGGASHSGNGASTLVDELESLAADIRDHKMHHSLPTLRALFYRCGGELVHTLAVIPSMQ